MSWFDGGEEVESPRWLEVCGRDQSSIHAAATRRRGREAIRREEWWPARVGEELLRLPHGVRIHWQPFSSCGNRAAAMCGPSSLESTVWTSSLCSSPVLALVRVGGAERLAFVAAVGYEAFRQPFGLVGAPSVWSPKRRGVLQRGTCGSVVWRVASSQEMPRGDSAWFTSPAGLAGVHGASCAETRDF